MSIWIILSWICVLILTGLNLFVFLKLKQVGEQVLKALFPGTKDMTEAWTKLQGMAKGLNRGANGNSRDTQLKTAMSLLQQKKQSAKR